MQALMRIAILLTIVQAVYCVDIESTYDWTVEHEFSSENAYYWNNTMLQVAVKDNLLYVNTIDPRLNNLVKCIIPNKTGSKWPFDSDYNLLSLKNGKVLILQDETFDIVNLTSCTIEVEFNHTCKLFVLNADFFDCFPKEQSSEEELSYDRYDENGKLVNHFKIKRNLELLENSTSSQVSTSENPSSKISYYSWESTVLDSTALVDPNSKSKVKILDHEYGLVSEQVLENLGGSVHSFAHDNLTVCHQWINLSLIINYLNETKLDKINLDELGYIECRLYDRNLKLQSTVKISLPKEALNEYAHIFHTGYLMVHNLLGGGAFILFQISTDEVFYRVINADGKVSEKNEVFYKFEKHIGNVYEEFNFGQIYLSEKSATDRIYCGFFGIWGKFSGKCMKI